MPPIKTKIATRTRASRHVTMAFTLAETRRRRQYGIVNPILHFEGGDSVWQIVHIAER